MHTISYNACFLLTSRYKYTGTKTQAFPKVVIWLVLVQSLYIDSIESIFLAVMENFKMLACFNPHFLQFNFYHHTFGKSIVVANPSSMIVALWIKYDIIIVSENQTDKS